MSPFPLGPTFPVLGIAVAVALHASTWGAFKDSPYEGYHPWRQLRTLVVAGLAAWLAVGSGVADPGALLPALGTVYALERLATEWWKAIVRSEDQGAYTIPMRLGFQGRPVDVTGLRWAAGAAILIGLASVGLLVHLAQQDVGPRPGPLVAPLVGGLGGWFTAVGGAWKDAPIEGFSGWKFLRSPVVATAWAAPLSLLADGWVTLGLAAAGMAVASIETYKTFLAHGRPPGKFETASPRWVLPGPRRVLGRAHAAGWAAFGVVSLVQAGQARSSAAAAVAAAVAVGCAVAVVVVLRASRSLADAATPVDPVSSASRRPSPSEAAP